MNDFKVGDRVVVWDNRNGSIRRIDGHVIVDLDSGHEMYCDFAKPDPKFKGFHIGDKVVNKMDSLGKGEILGFKYHNQVACALVKYNEFGDTLTGIYALELDKGEKEIKHDFKIGDRVVVQGRKGFVRLNGNPLEITLDDGGFAYSHSAQPDPEFKGFHVGDKFVDTSDSRFKGEILKFKYDNSGGAYAFVSYGKFRQTWIKISALELDKGEKEMEKDFTGPDFKGFHVGDRVNILNEYGTYTISELKYIGSLPVAVFRNLAINKSEIIIPISSLHLVESGEKEMEQEKPAPTTNELKWRPIAEWNKNISGQVLFSDGSEWWTYHSDDTTHFLVLPELPKPEITSIDLNELTPEKRDAIKKVLES